MLGDVPRCVRAEGRWDKEGYGRRGRGGHVHEGPEGARLCRREPEMISKCVLSIRQHTHRVLSRMFRKFHRQHCFWLWELLFPFLVCFLVFCPRIG